ncbi:hypothetical protein MalM25_21100 [Planctomycetes bacterium MalM25]|nr:hypothetical protein MalM25_21100 [Planctomycetes bacterium MalM25]
MTTLRSLLACLVLAAAAYAANANEDNGGWAPLKNVTPGENPTAAPSDAIVLFDGTDFAQWTGGDKWTIEEGEAVVGKSWLVTKRSFGDCQIHLEWSAPSPAEPYDGAKRGNSGVHLMKLYEFQIMDAHDNVTAPHRSAGSMYKQVPPAVNAVRPPGEWNVCDLFWTAPEFDEQGELAKPGYLTAVLNGVLILNHAEVQGKTSHKEAPIYKAHEARRPFSLQNHSSPVRFRNIWARDFEFPERVTPSEG